MRYLIINDQRIKRKPVLNPDDVMPIFKALILPEHQYKEHFLAICLDARNVPINAEVVSIGTLNACLVHPREVFRTAVVKHAAILIVAHNHPSGNVEASDEDVKLAIRLKKAGDLLGIAVIDQFIFSGNNYLKIKL